MLAVNRIALSFCLALAAAAPALAMPPEKTQQPVPANTPVIDDAAPIDEAQILDMTTPEDRARMMLRCAGPPPRPDHIATARPQPMSEKPVG